MSKKSKGSKNDAKNRNSRAALRRFNGEEVEPIMYDGSAFKHGKFMAAKYKDKTKGEGLIVDGAGIPIAYARCHTAGTA